MPSGGVTVCLNSGAGPRHLRRPAPATGFDSGYEPDGSWVASYSGINLQKGNNVDRRACRRWRSCGSGTACPGGDLDRIVRQQYFLSAVFRKVTSAGTLLNPLKLNRLLNAVSSSLQFDGNSAGHTGLDPLKLAQQMQNLAAGNLTFTTIPVSPQTIDGKDVEVTDTSALPAFVAGVIGTPQVSAYSKAKVVDPATVTVSVLNGTEENQLASTNAAVLDTVGFKTSTGSTGATTATQIRYPVGLEAQAKTLAQYVPGVSVVTNSDVKNVTLVMGTDGKKAVGSKSTPTTSAPTSSAAVQRNAATVDCIN